MKMQICLKGLDQLERQGNKLIKEVTSEETKLLLKQARLIRDRIKQKAPVGPTGNLKKATYAKALPKTMTSPAVAFAGIRPRRAPHARLVEYGHGGPHPAPPHPFFRPAVDEVKETVKRNIKEGLGKAVKGAV